MSLPLPRSIKTYFSSDEAGDAEALASCFAPDATVQDEGHTYEGLEAIKAWRVETKKQYDYKAEPLGSAERDGKTVVTSRVSGNFPGSPVQLEFIFGLAGDKIESLEIRS